VVSHPSDKNKYVARVGHPDFAAGPGSPSLGFFRLDGYGEAVFGAGYGVVEGVALYGDAAGFGD
jgi:hypothetical protein